MEIARRWRADRVEIARRWRGDRTGAERDVAALLTAYDLPLTTYY